MALLALIAVVAFFFWLGRETGKEEMRHQLENKEK